MPFSGEVGRRIYWKMEGMDDAPTLVLLNSIGTDMDLWAAVLPYLRSSHKLLRIDTRGHGASDVVDGDYKMSALAADVFTAMDAAGVTSAAVAGVSLGGMIAMEMALAHPGRVSALALVCTSVTMDQAAWAERVAKVRGEGMDAIADLAMGRFLSPEFTTAELSIAHTVRRQLVAMAVAGYAGCASAIRDMDLANRIGNIDCRALVVTGDRDTSTPFEGHGKYLVENIPAAYHVGLPAAHLAPHEAPYLLSETILDFLKD
jgi:3-oxoadipate enol-lactonase